MLQTLSARALVPQRIASTVRDDLAQSLAHRRHDGDDQAARG
jgi:hypothetical protein